MAYIDQEQKKRIVANVKKELAKVLGKDKLTVTFSIRHHMKICATIKSGTIDFDKKGQVNHYYIDQNYSGKQQEVLMAINKGLLSEHWDKSDIQSDHFNCSYYIDIQIGSWDVPYKLL